MDYRLRQDLFVSACWIITIITCVRYAALAVLLYA